MDRKADTVINDSGESVASATEELGFEVGEPAEPETDSLDPQSPRASEVTCAPRLPPLVN